MAEPRMEGLGFSPLELAGRRAVAGRGGGVQGSPCGQLLAEIKNREDIKWHLKTSQLALALAIIRSKPPDKSSKDYTEHLAKLLSGQDSTWKSRVEVLETEVLHLRQQLLLSKLSSGFHLENSSPVVINDILQSTSTEEFSGLLEDSGCDVSNDSIINVLETGPSLSHRECGCNSSISNVSSNALPRLSFHCASKQEPMVAHMQFLQHFIELRKLTVAGDPKTDLRKLGSDYSTVSDSFSRLLDCLLTSYSLPELPFSGFMTRAVCVITTFLSDPDLSSQVLGKCFKKLEDSVNGLVTVILNNRHLNRVQESVCHALVLLGKCSVLRNYTRSLLFREVSRFAEELRHVNEVEAKYYVQYENIFFLCRALEQLLEERQQDSAASSHWDEEERKKVLQSLDQALFHLSDEFPLFCMYLWRLGTLVNASEK